MSAFAATALRTWTLAIRVRTLTAAAVPVLVGTAVAARGGPVRPGLAAITLLCALLIQAGTNLLNDWGDFHRGADGAGRLGPQRVTQAGLVSAGRVLAAGVLAFTAAAALGLFLVVHGGWPIVVIGGAAIFAGIAYTAGPYPLAYHGLGEVFVFLFFGLVAVCGTEFLLGGRVSPAGLAAAVPVGLLATAILIVNNVRDMESDGRAGKRTLAVRFGRAASRALYASCIILSLAAPGVLAAARLSSPGVLLAWASAPLVVKPMRLVLTRTDGPSLNVAFVGTARVHLVFGVLLAAGLAW